MDIAVIIPAYNEEKTIANVIKAVREVDIIKKVIVVSDGSTDNTVSIAESLRVDVISLEVNTGKGGAIKAGLNSCTSDIVVFLDADLIGLNKTHIMDLLAPVMNDSADMSIGIFESGRFVTDLAQRIAPNLSGQRALKRHVVDDITHLDITKYGVEAVLTMQIKRKNIRVKTVKLKDMTHCMKEEKLGFSRGFAARLKMYWDIIKCLRLQKAK